MPYPRSKKTCTFYRRSDAVRFTMSGRGDGGGGTSLQFGNYISLFAVLLFGEIPRILKSLGNCDVCFYLLGT